uniref:Tetratricopeptide TPR_2 repeat protein n=1 Tax=mine drainage metagenome TaxID=410659 RepID=E6QL00_9ZZZZ
MSYYGEHRYAPAIPYLKQAAAAEPRNLELRLTLAHCYLWTHQLEATLGVYKEILQIDPDSAEADMIAGEALDEKGDNAGAVEQFRAAEKANPKEPEVHFGLAYLLWAQKRYEEAITEFQAELKNDPANNQARIYLGDTYMQMGRYPEAKEQLLIAEKSDPKMPLIHLDLGIVDQETNQREAALLELKETIALTPANVNAHFRLARIYQQTGQRELAKVEFDKAKNLNKEQDESLHQRIAEANARPSGKAATPQNPTGQNSAPQP